MNHPSTFPAAIRARVHDGAIDRVTRFFASSLAEAFIELIQNSRRSGATRVDVVTEAVACAGASGDIRVTVSDDGDGIADPAVLLSFGESGWDEDTARLRGPRRDGRLCALEARLRDFLAGARRRRPYRSRLARRAHARVLPRQGGGRRGGGRCPLAPRHLDLVHRRREPRHDRRRRRSRCAPLPAARHLQRRGLHAEGLPRRRRPCRALARPRLRRLQEQAHRLQQPRPQLPRPHPRRAPAFAPGRRGRHLVGACRHRGLPRAGAGAARPQGGRPDPLPRRDARAPQRLAIYRALAAADPAPRVSFADYRKAADAGIALPVPPAELRSWRPGIADIDDWRAAPPYAPSRRRHTGYGGRSRTAGRPGLLARRRAGRDRRPPVRERHPLRGLRLVRRSRQGARRPHRRDRRRRHTSPRRVAGQCPIRPPTPQPRRASRTRSPGPMPSTCTSI